MRDRLAVAGGLILPCAVSALLVPFRSSFPNTDAALLLVAVVVLVAANGHRFAGALAAISAAAWFDFFLTRPYETFSINRHTDVETTVLLVAVGVAVTELAVRGRRHRAIAQTEAAYLDAISATTQALRSGGSTAEAIGQVRAELVELLHLRGCRFETGRFGGLARLAADGSVRTPDDHAWDLDGYGMPATEIELTVAGHGRFVLDPTPGVLPSLLARRTAGILAGQLAASHDWVAARH